MLVPRLNSGMTISAPAQRSMVVILATTPVTCPSGTAAIESYATDVRSRAFPGPEHVYEMKTSKG